MLGLDVRYEDPIWLVSGILFVIGVTLLAALIARGWSAKRHKKVMLAFSILPQLACLALLCLALNSPLLISKRSEGSGLLLVDISESMDAGVAEALLARIAASIPSSFSVRVVPFAQNPGPVAVPFSNVGSFSDLRESWERLNIGETDLARALTPRSASEESPHAGMSRVPLLLLSDGQETEGDALRAVSEHAHGSIIFPFFPLEAETDSPEQFQISALQVPLIVAAQKSAEIRVVVANRTGSEQVGTIEIRDEDKVVLRENITVAPESEKLIIATSDPSKEGMRKVSAELSPKNGRFPKSNRVAYLSGEKREKLLLISGSPEDARFLRQLWSEQAFQVTEKVAQPRLSELPEFGDFSVIVLNNVALPQLPQGSAPSLRRFAQEGGGLLMIGGDKSFGLGGYIGSAVEETLPVILRPPEAEQKRLNIAVMLVLDKSRSMAEEQRIEFSKEAAREVVRNLKDDDYVGIIAFDLNPFEVLRLGQLAQIRNHAMERIGRLYPGESTYLFPAMEEARRRLESVPASRKHMIILTDGQLKDAGPRYLESINQMRLLGITISTVLVGSESDFGFLRSMAERGGGTFHRTTSPSNLARIFLEDIKVRTGERTMKERQEFLVRPGPSGVLSTSISAFPPVTGFVETRQRPGAQLELVTSGSEGSKPLLASWKYGGGKVSAFTSDANGRWSQYWVGWRGFREFWNDMVESLRGEKWKNRETVKFDLRYFVERKELILDLSVFNQISGGVEGIIKTPEGREEKVLFSESAAGRFGARLQNAKAGKYELRLKARSEKQPLDFTPVAFVISGELFGERKGEGFNTSLLEKLANRSGGRSNPSRADIETLLQTQEEVLPLRPYLLLIAAFLFCLGVLIRQRYVRVV